MEKRIDVQMRDVGPIVGQFWASVADARPASDENWPNVSDQLVRT